ncbi:MAG: hypothetical protein EXS30_09895 [Pedosphaera sp.]|nr:hypothetical protein [Pedosphaera sp.]
MAFLLASPVLTLVCASINNDLGAVSAFVTSAVAGVACGSILGRRLGSTASAKLLLAILFALLLLPLCFYMNFFGCAVGNEFAGRHI